jgi:enamine deaminase RidA (YjgF/YER057c/UK114 family)
MEKRIINPSNWSEKFGFVQGVEVTGDQRTLYCSGQVSVDAEGNLLHAGDMQAQMGTALDNADKLLKMSGYEWSEVVRLNYYTTDVPLFMEAAHTLGERLGPLGCVPSSTLLGVTALFHPDALIEIEITAEK